MLLDCILLSSGPWDAVWWVMGLTLSDLFCLTEISINKNNKSISLTVQMYLLLQDLLVVSCALSLSHMLLCMYAMKHHSIFELWSALSSWFIQIWIVTRCSHYSNDLHLANNVIHFSLLGPNKSRSGFDNYHVPTHITHSTSRTSKFLLPEHGLELVPASVCWQKNLDGSVCSSNGIVTTLIGTFECI